MEDRDLCFSSTHFCPLVLVALGGRLPRSSFLPRSVDYVPGSHGKHTLLGEALHRSYAFASDRMCRVLHHSVPGDSVRPNRVGPCSPESAGDLSDLEATSRTRGDFRRRLDCGSRCGVDSADLSAAAADKPRCTDILAPRLVSRRCSL